MQIFTNFTNDHMSCAGLFLKFDCEFSRWVESNNDLIDFLDYFFKECAKENLPDLLMHVMNSGICR